MGVFGFSVAESGRRFGVNDCFEEDCKRDVTYLGSIR